MAYIALLFGYGLAAWMVQLDRKLRQAGTWALWIPALWLLFQGSRPLSFWLVGEVADGNAIDTVMDGALLLGAIMVLRKRGLHWGELLTRNKALCLIYIYYAISLLWSEMPILTLKRVVKDFGTVLIALVFLTEEDPIEAIRGVFVRLSYLLIPMSIVAIKWFPNVGRQARGSGDSMFRGVAPHKNMMGMLVFIFSIILLWDLIEIWKRQPRQKQQIWIRVMILAMGFWCLHKCDSQTSMLCLIMGTFIFWAACRLVKMPQGKKILITCLVIAGTMAVLDQTFHLKDIVIKALGRDPNITGRTDIWKLVKEQGTDPVFGDGFYVFWDTPKGKSVMDDFMVIKSTHNGYLEVYVDGGLVADCLLVIFLLAAGRRIVNRLFDGDDFAKVGLAFWLTAIIYNFSESSFFRRDLFWFMLLLVSVECPTWNRLEDPASILAEESEVPPDEEFSAGAHEGKHF
jgi:O-antigen ligase